MVSPGVMVAPGMSWSCVHWESASPTPYSTQQLRGPRSAPRSPKPFPRMWLLSTLSDNSGLSLTGVVCVLALVGIPGWLIETLRPSSSIV